MGIFKIIFHSCTASQAAIGAIVGDSHKERGSGLTGNMACAFKVPFFRTRDTGDCVERSRIIRLHL